MARAHPNAVYVPEWFSGATSIEFCTPVYPGASPVAGVQGLTGLRKVPDREFSAIGFGPKADNNYVTFTGGSAVTGAFTMGGWFHVVTAPGASYPLALCGHDAGSTAVYGVKVFLYSDLSVRAVFGYGWDGSKITVATDAGVMPLGVSTHIEVAYDSVTKTCYLFVNGILRGSTVFTLSTHSVRVSLGFFTGMGVLSPADMVVFGFQYLAVLLHSTDFTPVDGPNQRLVVEGYDAGAPLLTSSPVLTGVSGPPANEVVGSPPYPRLSVLDFATAFGVVSRRDQGFIAGFVTRKKAPASVTVYCFNRSMLLVAAVKSGLDGSYRFEDLPLSDKYMIMVQDEFTYEYSPIGASRVSPTPYGV